MAVVKLGNKVKTNLPDMIRYVINPEKNDGGRLVYASYSSERHDANMLAEPMIRDLERCANGLRKDGVLALHLKHSFSPDEHVNAEQVHELGVMLTEAITGGDYKYVVSPHMDRHHLHNHIVICAANRRTGRKMRLTRRSIDQWRAVSDELCRREGLAVLENPKVETAESRVRDERERLKNERKRIREDIAKQVERESERMRRRLKESSDRQRERDKRILFALCLGVCSAVVPMFAVVMQGRWQAFADSLLDWLRMCGRQLAVVGQWLADIDARLDEIIPSGWWDRPLVFLLMLLLAAVVCGMPLARSRRICGGCFYDDERLAYGRNPGSPYRSLDVGCHGGLRPGRPSRHDPAQSGGLARLVDSSHCCRAPDLSGEAGGPNQPIH